MLSTQHKAVILRKAGIAVPSFPQGHSQRQEGDQEGEASASPRQLVAGNGDSGDAAEDAQEAAFDAWSKAVDKLYADYALARAAHSLREPNMRVSAGVRRSGSAAGASRRPGLDADTASGEGR